MSNNNEKPLHLGTRQCDRFPSALSKDYVKIDERSFNDLIQQMSEYAKKVNFYNDDNPDKPDGNWEPFFKEIYDYETQSIKLRTLQKQMNEGTVPPHLSLLLSFLKLYQIEQNNLNRLTERHLEFYYKNVLGFTPRVGKVGNAVVFVSPVKNTSSVIIPKGTLFDAGKDSKGKTILFESTDEVTINKAQVNDCYYSHRFDNGNYDIETLQIQSRTQDSVETNSNDTIQETINLNFGFAIAISSFLEAKNQKYIDLGTLGEEINLEYFTAEYTSINGWEKIDCFPQDDPTADLNNEKKDEPLRDNESDNQEKNHYLLKIDGVMHPMIPYNPKLHGEGYNSNNPIIRFLPANAQDSRIIDSKKNELWNVLNIKHDSFNNIRLREIESTDNLIIENKYGMVNNVAGSSPFGYICQKKDYFSVKINIPSREFYSNLNDDTYTINLNINDLGINDLLKKESNMKLEYPVIQYTLKNDDRRIDKRINKFLNSKEDETYEDYETDEEFETNPTYSLILESASETTIQAIRLMKEMTGLGLDVATQMINETPITIKENVDETTAENIMNQFEKVGATVEINSNSKTTRTATRRKKKAKTNEDEPETKFNVILKSAGASKLQIVKIIKELVGFGLKEAKELVDSAPCTVMSNVDKETVETIKKQLEEAGATVEITDKPETAETKKCFNVFLISAGANKLNVIKLIREFSGLGLGEAKVLVENNAPAIIKENVNIATAEDIKKRLEDAGATVEITCLSETDTSLENPTETGFNVFLKSVGANKLQIVKTIKESLGLGLKEAKDLVDSAPITIKENIDKETAEDIKKQLEDAGATVEITCLSETDTSLEYLTGTGFNVFLKSVGANKLQIVKTIKESLGLGLKEAKDLVDSAPITIKENIDKETAEDIKKQLEDAGATVEITSNSETFNVILNSIGENTIQLIKLIEQYTNLGLKKSIEIIENTPYEIMSGVEEASMEMEALESTGARVTLIEDVNSNITEKEDEEDPTNPYTTFELKKAISYNSNILIPTQKMELFTIAPWGINKIDPQDGNKSDSKESDDAANYIFQDAKFPPLKYVEGEEESGVFIAISGISQPTCLNIYFELGSYNINKQIIKWSYLSAENKWKEFSRKNVCKDGTENFSKNGIVQLYLNKEVFRIKDDIPADKIWLYVSTQKTDGQKDTKLDDFLHKIKYIQTQAVEVSFSEESVGTLQNEICLPQGSITKLIKSITGIKKVEQPFDGFVGIASETTDEFNCRVSEKLRHKGKAWTSWDYERILLERFPQLAAVRCVPCSSDDSGTVKIVVFPNVSLIPQGDIRKPQIDAFTKNEIEHYLKTLCSPFVNIEILNPSYKEVDITGKITLRKEYHDHTYYLKLIEEALTNYLAPWRSNPMNISLTTHTPKNLEIQYFLEKLEYVDFIKELSVDSKSLNEEELTIITYNSIEITID